MHKELMEVKMVQTQDWLADPLMIRSGGNMDYLHPKGLENEQADKWESFHFCTKLKLEAADHFCRLLLGVVSMPDNLGFPTLAYKQSKWYLDTFFFELKSAYDILLHELNTVYAQSLNLTPEDVSGPAIKSCLPKDLSAFMEDGWKQPWFEKIRYYRNTATHYSYIPGGSFRTGWGGKPWSYEAHEVSMYYVDTKADKVERENINQCTTYLCKMIEHISQVWTEMRKDFDAKETPR